jgi:signal peptidase I
MYNPFAAMAIYRKISPGLYSALWLAVLFFIWLAFAPTQAGGLASYVIIIGQSMEPEFHIGDLVIVHQEAAYHKGDAVAYKNPELNGFVFHRIIGQSLGQFSLQGDNNSWIDTYQPTSREILGKLWVHIPNGGFYIQKIRNPVMMAFIAGILGIVLASSLFTEKKDKKAMNKKPSSEWFSFRPKNSGGAGNSTPGMQWGGMLENSFFILGLIAFVSLLLAGISFTRPATVTVDADIPYGQLGFFSYSAIAPQNIYDANSLKSGDPVFTKLTCVLDVGFRYTLVTPQSEAIAGTYQLTASVTEPSTGWQRSIPLQKETAFSGTEFETSARVNLCEIDELTQFMEANTEFHPSTYIIQVQPKVKVTGLISSQAFDDEFDPALGFTYDRIVYRLMAKEGQNPLNPSSAGVLTEKRSQPGVVSFLGISAQVSTLRTYSLLGLGLSIAAMVFLWMMIQDLNRKNPVSLIQMKYESIMVDVHYGEMDVTERVVDVTSIDHLAKLAERYNAMILHAVKGSAHLYFVQKDGTIYRFILQPFGTDSGVPENEAGNRERKS